MYKFAAIFITTLLLVGHGAFAQPSGQKVKLLLGKEMLARQIPGLQVVVARHGEIILSQQLGVASKEFNVPVHAETVFSINSIAKVFAATAVMQLVEQGKLNLDSTIFRYLKDLPAPGKRSL